MNNTIKTKRTTKGLIINIFVILALSVLQACDVNVNGPAAATPSPPESKAPAAPLAPNGRHACIPHDLSLTSGNLYAIGGAVDLSIKAGNGADPHCNMNDIRIDSDGHRNILCAADYRNSDVGWMNAALEDYTERVLGFNPRDEIQGLSVSAYSSNPFYTDPDQYGTVLVLKDDSIVWDGYCS